MTYDEIETLCRAQGLTILGGFSVKPAQDKDLAKFKTLLMIGPDEPKFWGIFRASKEYDAPKDPLDRWSKRVLGQIADALGAKAFFPSDGPPYAPFFSWALQTGRCHSSPVNLLVHDRAGMMVSFRGALALQNAIALPDAPPSPCASCIDQPCLSTCPVSALTPDGYDVEGCKSYIARDAESVCMSGCQARLACPVSRSFGRLPEQSAFHMRAFLGE